MSPSQPPRVVLIEDEALLRGLLVEFFQRSGQFEVSGAFDTGKRGVDAVERIRPDLLLLDLQLPDVNGLWVVQNLSPLIKQGLRVLVLSGSTNPLAVKQLMRHGVRGILQKGISAAELVATCHRVMRGGICLELPEGALIDYSPAPATGAPAGLTDRETEVLELVARGWRSKQIATSLGLSVRTVDKHRENLMRKVGVHDVTGLIRFAMESGMLKFPTGSENRPAAAGTS